LAIARASAASAERPEALLPEAFFDAAAAECFTKFFAKFFAELFTEPALLEDLVSDFFEGVFLLRVSATVMTPLAGEPEIIPEE
jgi:hypothetical protein